MNHMQEIIKCSNISECLIRKDKANPCYKITANQKASYNNFKVPEPWSGHIDSAPLLFLNLYPQSIDDEEYPTIKWSDIIINDFFHNRFNGRTKKWVKDDLYPLSVDSNFRHPWSRSWSSIKSRALELYNERVVLPGVDYSISYLVHCKTKKNIGVADSAEECIKKHLRKLLLNAQASVIVVMGNKACTTFKREFDITKNYDSGVIGPVKLEGKERYIAFLPHPTYWGPRSFSELISSETVNFLNLHLRKCKTK